MNKIEDYYKSIEENMKFQFNIHIDKNKKCVNKNEISKSIGFYESYRGNIYGPYNSINELFTFTIFKKKNPQFKVQKHIFYGFIIIDSKSNTIIEIIGIRRLI